MDNQLASPILDKYSKWVAEWNEKCTYIGKYDMWQYTSDGAVDGIAGRVDMNISYKDVPTPAPHQHQAIQTQLMLCNQGIL